MIVSDRERQAPTTVSEAEPSHLARYEFARQFLKGTDEVLDVPCGSGYGSCLMSKVAKKVIGIDIHAGAIEHAKECFQEHNIEFAVGNMETLDSLTVPFDVVVSFEGIEHIHNQDAFLESIARLLKPNGYFIISTPRKPHGSPYHTIEFNLDEFKTILSEKFVIEKMYGQIYTDIFDMTEREEDPHAYHRFNFIAVCRLK